MNVTTKMIKELREATGAGILESKKILESVNGDFEKAVTALRKKGKAKVEKRAGREAREGVIELYAHPGNRVGVMLELNCETDFVGRTDEFRALAHDLALHIAASSPRYISRENIPAEQLEKVQQEYRNRGLNEGKPEKIIEKIVESGTLKYYEESCLLEQPFVKDESKTIKVLIEDAIRVMGENIIIRRFQRYELGEAL